MASFVVLSMRDAKNYAPTQRIERNNGNLYMFVVWRGKTDKLVVF